MSDEELRKLVRIAQQEPSEENLAKLGAAYLRYLVPTATLKIIGRRWTSRTYGNTYHTVSVYLDDEHLGTSGREYGYGDSYEQTGVAIAVANSNLPPPNQGEPPWRWAERIGIKLDRRVADVSRQRDL